MAAGTITAAEREQASKAAKAKKERARRAQIKLAAEALEAAELPKDTKLNAEQRARAAEWPGKHGGLRKKALATFILEGKNTAEQSKDSAAARQQKAREDRQQKNVTRSSDPEATELAQKAKALAPDIRSSFLPKEAREFMTEFKVGGRQRIKVERKKVDTQTFDRTALEAYAIGGQKDPEVRAQLTTLGKETRLWGRKLGLFILATAK